MTPKPRASRTAAGREIPEPPPYRPPAPEPENGPPRTGPSAAARYAKAIAAFVGTEAAAIATWAATLPDGTISRNGWIGLAIALVGPFVAATGVVVAPRNAAPTEGD